MIVVASNVLNINRVEPGFSCHFLFLKTKTNDVERPTQSKKDRLPKTVTKSAISFGLATRINDPQTAMNKADEKSLLRSRI